MVKYRLSINRELCIDCGLATGRCPPHARVIALIFAKSLEAICENEVGIIFPETIYPRVKKAAEGCPVKAIIVEKVEE
jgi:ferredoxin